MLDVNAHRNHIDETMVDEFHRISRSHPCERGCGTAVIDGSEDLHAKLCSVTLAKSPTPIGPSNVFVIKMRPLGGPPSFLEQLLSDERR